MTDILELLQQYTEKAPQTPILFDEVHTKGITYAQFDDMTGRVYAWLAAQGIGKEKFVLINLPRGVLPIIAMIGIWRAGAAWVLVEDNYAPERIAYIKRDCGCVTEINAENWNEVMHTEPLSGYIKADLHDAAYAVYTSGTTGNPKGVLHEYGNLGMAIESIRPGGINPFTGKDRLALLAPMNFVASIIVVLCVLNIFAGRMYVASYATIKNPAALKKLFFEKRITITFLTPSYARKIGTQTGPFLRMLFVGSEPANTLYNKKLELINIYAASESGFAVGVFPIDKSYETCPIGHPEVDIDIRLLNEDGTETAEGENGELCFRNPYVRGYLNLPEETEKSFIDGYFHTGDLARKDMNGNYILLGRRGDMIKINGNRIEPAEIEAALKAELGISWAAVRGFTDGEKSFLCAYYTDDISVDTDALRKNLMQRLPYYMIPAFYMKIDSIPMKESGKMDRYALPKPEIKDFSSDYEAPADETEKALCEAFARVLGLERVGRRDDFYEMGGDSLSSIEAISECRLPGLNVNEIFRGRTPEKIAQLYRETLEKGNGADPDEENRNAMQEEHLLTAEQLYMVDYQLYTPNSTMYNLFSMIKLDKETVDLEKMAEALEKAIFAHPALLTTYSWNEDGALVQRYTPEVHEPIHVERLSEFELRFVKDTLVYPFKIVGGKLYRCRVFETEKAGYLFFDVHHSLFDGTSLKVFLKTVGMIYLGMEPDPDYYYLMLKNREEEEQSAFYEESRKYFEDRYLGVRWSGYPKTDHESRDNELGEFYYDLKILQPQMKALEKAYLISRNEFFITVAALAISVYNDADDVKVAWNFNGREDAWMMSTVGLLFRELPIGIRFREEGTIRELFADVHDQVRGGIEHSVYPFVDIHSEVAEIEEAYVLYQQDIRDMNSGMDGFEIETVDIRQNQAASQTYLDIEVLDGEDGLKLMVDFAASRYEEESIRKFIELYVKIAHALLTHNSQKDMTVKELKQKVCDKKNFFRIISGVFRMKR